MVKMDHGDSTRYHRKGEVEMRKITALFVLSAFVFSFVGFAFAQSPSSTAVEKASDKAVFKRGDETPAGKAKSEKEKALKEKGDTEKKAKQKAEKIDKEKTAQEKAAKDKVKVEKEKIKAASEPPKLQ
jgi:hypothetical protein